MTDEQQIIEFEQQEPTFYARIPKLAVMELDPYALKLYCYYKQVASETGSCFKSTDTIVQEIGFSETRYKEARRELVKRGYITVTHQRGEDGIINTPATVRIVNIWKQNNDAYGGGTSGDPHRHTPWGGTSGDPKEESIKKLKDSHPQGAATRSARAEFTKAKSYPVNHFKKIIYTRAYSDKEMAPLIEQWAAAGVVPVRGSVLNTDEQYAEFKRLKPPAKRDPLFDAFAECAFKMPAGFDPKVLNGDGGRVGKLITILAETLGRTFNDCNADKALAAEVRACYAEWKKQKGLDAPRDPVAFIAWWHEWRAGDQPDGSDYDPMAGAKEV